MTPLAAFSAVLRAVSADSDLPAARILGRTRDAWTSQARWTCWWLLKQHGLSLHDIGTLFDKHHTSVMHGLRQLDYRLKRDPALHRKLSTMRREIRRGYSLAEPCIMPGGWGIVLGKVPFAPLVDNLVGCVSHETGRALIGQTA